MYFKVSLKDFSLNTVVFFKVEKNMLLRQNVSNSFFFCFIKYTIGLIKVKNKIRVCIFYISNTIYIYTYIY